MDYKEHYRQDALQFDYWGKDQFSAFEKRRNQAVFNMCEIKAGDRVLDVGSGRGWFSLQAAKQGASVTAIDLSEENLAKIRVAEQSIKTVCGDACEAFATEEKFDLIVALEILEHLVEPKLAVQNWKHLLAPHGKLIVTVPYKEVIRYSLCIHCNQKTPVNAHLHSFDKDSLVKLLNHHGFWVKWMQTFGHKMMAQFKLTEVVKWFPFGIWKFYDRFCRIFGDRYSYLAVIATLKE